MLNLQNKFRAATGLRRRVIMLGLVAGGLVWLPGCGGMSQSDMKQFAIRRTKDVEEVVEPSAAAQPPKVAQKNSSPAETVAKNRPQPPQPSPAETAADTSASDPPTSAELDDTAAPTASSSSATVSDTKSPPATPLTPDARARLTVDHLTRIGEAFQAYVEARTYYPARAIFDRANAPLLSWRVELLPYLGYKELYDQFRLEEPWNSRHNKALLTKIPAVYQSPERFDTRTNYLVPMSINTTFGRGIPAWPSTIEDGVRNTVFVVEADDALAVPWTQPSDYELDMAAPVRQLGALRGDWFYVVWGSGEVGRIPTSASIQHLKAMYTYDGGEDFFAGKIDQPLFPASLTASSTSPSGSVADSRATSIATAAADSLAPLAATYLERATSELARGADREAGQWFYASALAGPPGGAWVERYQWIPALRRPSPRLRFGIGLQYSGPRKNRLEQEVASRIASGKAGGGSTWSTVTGQIGKSLVQTIAAHVEQCGGHALADPPPVQPDRRVATQPVRAARGPSLLINSIHSEPLAPGVLFLALAEEPVLRTMASREGIDVLVLVEWQDVGHKQSVRVELFDTVRDVSIFQLPWVDSEAVAGALANPLASNPFPARLRQLAEFLEEQLFMQPLPEQIQPRHVVGRMAALAAATPDNPLASLAEMRYYRERGLADDARLLLGYQALIGQQPGSELFLGDAETRARVLKPWLPTLPPTTSAPIRTATADDD